MEHFLAEVYYSKFNCFPGRYIESIVHKGGISQVIRLILSWDTSIILKLLYNNGF